MRQVLLGFLAVLILALLPGVPALAQQITAPNDIIGDAYRLGLMVGGILAFLAIVWGGVRYALAAGDPGKQSDAKDRVVQAFIGLALLAGSYLVLVSINPGIVGGIQGLEPVDGVDVVGICPEACGRREACAGDAGCLPCTLECGDGWCIIQPGGGFGCATKEQGPCGKDNSFGICPSPVTQFCAAPNGTWSCYECDGSPERCPWLGTSG